MKINPDISQVRLPGFLFVLHSLAIAMALLQWIVYLFHVKKKKKKKKKEKEKSSSLETMN